MLSGRVHNNRARLVRAYRLGPSRTLYQDRGDNTLQWGTSSRRTPGRPATPGPSPASGVLSGCGSCRPIQHKPSRGGRSSGVLLRTLVPLSSGPPGSLGQMVRRARCAEVDAQERRTLSVAVRCDTHGLFLGVVGLLGAVAIIRHQATRLQSSGDVPGS